MRSALRHVSYSALQAMLALPRPLLLLAARLLGGGPLPRQAGVSLDPGLHLMLSLRRAIRTPENHTLSPEAARALARREAFWFSGPPQPVAGVEDLTIDGASAPLQARLYRSWEERPAPLIVFFHGGGFVIGDVDTHDQPCRLLARYAGADVLSVDYRLAPEHVHPAALEDGVAAIRWALAQAHAHGWDEQRIGVAGDSAGGTVATYAAAALANEIRAQLLIYPAVEPTTGHQSMQLFGKGFFLTRRDIEWFMHHYIAAADRSSDDLWPLRRGIQQPLPTAIVVTAGFDPLSDQGREYVDALRAAGTPCTHIHASRLIHGFINMTDLNEPARRTTIRMARAMRAVLATPRSAAAEAVTRVPA